VRKVVDTTIGVVLLAIGALAFLQWSLLFGFILMGLGLEQSGFAQYFVDRRRRNAHPY
jgi:hypothetical protein